MRFVRSTRSVKRRKMVLPVTVVRRDGKESLLAHTLDVTEISARLGGLAVVLEPGEEIEIRRGALTARFEVFWMGTPGSAMEGQAGVRSLESARVDWGIQLPGDEAEVETCAAFMRRSGPEGRSRGLRPLGKRWNTRFECSGTASVRATSASVAVQGQVKDISRGGVYVETMSPLPVNAEVYVKMEVEGTTIEGPGVVRTSYSEAGMGVSFQRVSQENSDKIADIIVMLRQKSHPEKNSAGQEFKAASKASSRPGSVSVEAIARTCRSLADDFERLRMSSSNDAIEDLSRALGLLQRKITTSVVVRSSQTPARKGA